MTCPENGWTVARMRSALGDFSMCKSASKYAARIGQCFSTTIQGASGQDRMGVETQYLRHCIIDDVWGDKDRTMCHSDGTGLIKREAMNNLLERIPFGPSNPVDVSIIQIRFGGAKGTLTAWDFEKLAACQERSRKSNDVCLRKSMIKFDAKFSHLEVCSLGKHVPYFLNRNVILLLHCHGVSEYTFLTLQREMLDGLDAMMATRECALRMVPKLSGPESGHRSMLMHMLHSGFCPTKEPFLFDCLHSIRSHNLFGLRKKSRIFVDRGAVLVGGLDETGLLPEGCVFCELFDASLEAYAPLVGPVMVTKHPVMHPGDVRMLLALDIPELRGHRNCILFSRKGCRPEADKMSGSDLDGDEMAVTWDERLFLKPWNGCLKDKMGRFHSPDGHLCLSMQEKTIESDARCLSAANAPAMDYATSATNAGTATEGLRLEDLVSRLAELIFSDGTESVGISFPPVNDADLSIALIRHFLDHIKLANVGRICMLWLDYAAVEGAGCDKCLILAGLHSIAVDYPKSGTPAVIPRELHLPRGTPRAHWREVKGLQSFHCESIIGQLYDEVIRRAKTSFDSVAQEALAGRQRDRYGSILCNAEGDRLLTQLEALYDTKIRDKLGISIAIAGLNDEIQFFANQQRAQYDNDWLETMNKYGIRSEGEVATGCIRKFHRLHKKRQHEFAEDVRRQVKAIRRKYRIAFFRKVVQLVRSEMEVYATGSFLDVGNEVQENKDDKDDEDDDDEEADYDSFVQDDDVMDDDEEEIEWAEKVATARTHIAPDGKEHDSLYHQTAGIRKWSGHLAAAYYDATYTLQLRWRERDKNMVLFSFPWLVVGDVIACGMAD